jgi:dGTPase
VLAHGGDAFDAFLARWAADPLTSVSEAEARDNRDALLSMLRDLFPFDGQYEDTFVHRAALRTASSNLIQRFVWAAKISTPGASDPIECPRSLRLQLKFLQRLVWTHVIDNPRLATQQRGQRRIIRTLFDTYVTAVKARDDALVPALFHRTLASLGDPRPEKDRAQDTPEETRLAVDIVAGFSDDQAVLLYRRITGVATGSITDCLSA